MTPRKHSKRPFRKRKTVKRSVLRRVLHIGAYLLVIALGGWYLKLAPQIKFWPIRGAGLFQKAGDLPTSSPGFRLLDKTQGPRKLVIKKQKDALEIEEVAIQRLNEMKKEQKLERREQLAADNDTSDEADNGLWEGDADGQSSRNSERQLTRSFQFPKHRRKATPGVVSRVAFGSCTARTKIPQPIWEQAVIPSEPDAWIWSGDLAYLDWPDVDCRVNPEEPTCNCEKDWLRSSYQSCLSGDLTHARVKLQEQLEHPDYVNFLQYMCPTWQPQGLRGPDGSDQSVCPKTILGTWDDHDYNWQDGNRRLPRKEAHKQLFLDALGVREDDARRQVGRGLYAKHTLNRGIAGKEIDVFLLDGRYYRDPKPCALRKEFCEKMVLTDPKKDKYAWCEDFLHGGKNGDGSCCKKDEAFADAWCQSDGSNSDPLWAVACDPTAPSYGQDRLTLQWNERLGRQELVRSERRELEEGEEDESVMCEVLGHEQRLWLTSELQRSQAPLKLVVVGSPVFNNPSKTPCKGKTPKGLDAPVTCPCFDDFDCYRPAQVALLHSLARAPGCPVVITGDFHFSDIKVLQPGESLYSPEYKSKSLGKPIHQVMASGLTVDTAKLATCQGFHKDRMGLRVPGECNFVAGPAFGFLEVDWETRVVSLQLRDGDGGDVQVETSFHLESCSALKDDEAQT